MPAILLALPARASGAADDNAAGLYEIAIQSDYPPHSSDPNIWATTVDGQNI